MYQQHIQYDQSAGSINDHEDIFGNFNAQHEGLGVAQLLRERRELVNYYVEQLYSATFIQRPGERVNIRAGGRRNKNEILGLILARLLKEKHIKGDALSFAFERLRGIQTNASNGEFVLVLRTDGRIICMSDEAEQHLGKSMRSLYTQFINIFECLNKADGDKLKSILNSAASDAHQEHKLVCTLRLPKGKRPSRANEDVQTITMAGHFFSCNESASSEKLFIARCESLLSTNTQGATSSQTTTIINNDNPKSMITLTLNEDMSIHGVSPNVKDILGYTKNDMSGNWVGRYLATGDLEKFENLQKQFFQHEQKQKEQKPIPVSICELLDIYTNNGDGRLTFMCQIRIKRQRRTKPIQYIITAQLVDPLLRNEYIRYAQSEANMNLKSNKVKQVNLVSPSISKTSEETILAHSPSLDMGLLMSEASKINDTAHHQQYSPVQRSLSNFVAPVKFDDEFWEQLFNSNFNQYSAETDIPFWSTDSFDPVYSKCQSEQDLETAFAELYGH